MAAVTGRMPRDGPVEMSSREQEKKQPELVRHGTCVSMLTLLVTVL